MYQYTMPHPTRGSSSSPPRGLREAYERIVDEEALAAEESAEDGLPDAQDDDTLDWSTPHLNPVNYQDRLRDADYLRVDRLSNSPSPISLSTQRARSPRDLHRPARDDVVVVIESPLGSQSGSSVSGISSLENGTADSLIPVLAKHARDQQRINGALKSTGRVFSKARLRPPKGLAAEDLQRRDIRTGNRLSPVTQAGKLGKAGSVSSEQSDPPIHVPRDWGRKARKNTDWLNRIREEATEQRVSERSGQVHGRKPTPGRRRQFDQATEGVDRAVAPADEPLPSIELMSPSATDSARLPTHNSASRVNASLDRIRQWEVDEDFTARSIQASTSPPIKTRNSTLDRIREREMESLKDRQVTTSRLGELKERRSKEPLRPAMKEEAESDANDAAKTAPSLIPRRLPMTKLSAVSNENLRSGDRPPDSKVSTRLVPDSPVTIFRSEDRGEEAKVGPEATEDKDRTSNRNQRKQDSLGFLKQLARATSTSPSPAKDSETIESQRQREVRPSRLPKVNTRIQSKSSEQLREASSKAGEEEKEDESREREQRTPTARRNSAPKATPNIGVGGWIDTPAPGRPLNTKSAVESDLAKDNKSEAVDTLPTTTSGIRSSSETLPLPSQSNQETVQGIKDDQNDGDVPRIVRPAPLTAMRSHAIERLAGLRAELGDDYTVDSLDNLVTQTPEYASLIKPEEAPDKNEGADLGLTTSQRSRRDEVLKMQQLDKHLRRAEGGLRDTRRQMDDLGNVIENSAERVWAAPREPQRRPIYWDDFYTPFISREGRLTWLGIVILVGLFCWKVEVYLCNEYCHPRFARGPRAEVNLSKPIWPFVTYQLTKRRFPWPIQQLEDLYVSGLFAVASVLDSIWTFFFSFESSAYTGFTDNLEQILRVLVDHYHLRHRPY